MAGQQQSEKSIFLTAVEMDSEAERAAFIEQACTGNPQLRAEVQALLQAHVSPQPLLDAAPVLGPTIDQPVPELPHSVIGPYKLLEQIGEGGMGTVWMAQQMEPVKRVVALKLIKTGMASKQVIARFEAERQALALMEHPNIARVLDVGQTSAADAGGSPRPYFVMDLVKGVPITKYCDEHHLTPRERLELFVPVCQAVQHAHQKGIIHRDLKPSNVLVALYDGKPVPKVIDFGVAKAVGQQLTDQTLVTGFGAVVGTLEYMSPEQAEVNQLDVDTRSDIYSLGVLLYELLAGSPPFSRKELELGGMLEMLRIIREQEPSKPSTKLSTAEGLPTLAANRGTEPAELTKLMRGELDWIVMKALEKDRNRRYESANGFAQDVQRYLCGEAVQAVPPSAGYRFRKLVRRNRAAFGAIASGLLVILFAITGLAINNWLVAREKKEKEAALERTIEEKGRADENLARARNAVKEFLIKTSDNPVLKTGDFQQLRKELLETAIPFYLEFVRQKQDDPDLEAERGEVFGELGFVHRELGNLPQAVADFDQAESIFQQLSTTFPERPLYRLHLADAKISRGDNLVDQGKVDPAEQAYRQAHDILDQLVSDHGEPNYRESLARATNSLGLLLKESSRPADAEKMLRQALGLLEKLVAEQPKSLPLRGQLAQSWLNLGGLQYGQRQADDAQKAFQQAIDLLDPETLKKLAGGSPISPKYLAGRRRAWNNLGVIHRDAHRYPEAEKAQRESLAIKEELADRFPSVPQYRHELARSYNNRGALLASIKRPKDAQIAYEKSVGIYERLSADPRAIPLYAVELAGTYTNLGRLMGDNGQLAESLPVLTKGVDTLETALGKDSRLLKVRESLLVAHWARALTLGGLKRYQPAVDDWSRAIELDDGRYFVGLRVKRASALLHLKDHVRAAADAQAIADSAIADGEDIYNAACVLALAAKFAEANKSMAESYASRAVELLRRAFAKGFGDLAHMKQDSDLKPLQGRGDFTKLINDLTEKQKELDCKKKESGDKKPKK